MLNPLSAETPILPEIQANVISEPVVELGTMQTDLPALTGVEDEPEDVSEPAYGNSKNASSGQFADILSTHPDVLDLPVPSQPDIVPADVGQPVQDAPTPVSPGVPLIDEHLPEFLRYGSVKKYRMSRRKTRIRLRGIIHSITVWLLVLFVIALAYTAWLHKPMIASEKQKATNTAARLALAINERDYAEVYRNTLWTDHYKQAFRSSADINRFCQNLNQTQSFRLHHLAELWQMKHTVVVSGKLIGRNSIGYTFIDTSSDQQTFQFTLTRTPSKRWMWDIAYDYRLAPSDIPLLNHIMVQSRLQEAK
ncbi:MAG: hypothetical protein ACYC1M_04925 [Armatimonadota bacterium]